jgi:hypothetical protein
MLLNPTARMGGIVPGFATFELYLLRRSLTPLLVGTIVVLAALLLERLLRLLDLVVNKGSPIGLILKLLLNLTPHYIGIALSISRRTTLGSRCRPPSSWPSWWRSTG